MGARNAVAAYQRWAGRVPGASMQVLVYMALVSKDSDDWPWYGQGQAALAELALGREHLDATDLRAVSRAMTPLLDAGAVTVERAATHRSDGNSTARYRLNLTERADTARLKWEQSPDGKRRMTDPRRKTVPYDGKRRVDDPSQDQSHTTFSGKAIRRKVTSHTTFSDEPYDGNRRTKEEEETRGARKPRNKGDLSTTSHSPRAIDEATPNNIVEFPPRTKPTRPAWSRSAAVNQALTEASERRRAAEAAHHATKEAT